MTDTPHPATIVAYLRVSTQRQGASGLGLEAQRETIRVYAAKQGIDPARVVEFVEVESGKRTDRPELRKALDTAKALRAPLVVAKLDRLARNAGFVHRLHEAGVEFVACDFPHANRLMVGILSMVAEYEAEMTSKRTKDALAAAKARGVVLGGNRGDRGKQLEHLAKARRTRARATSDAARQRHATLHRAIHDAGMGDAHPNEVAVWLNAQRYPRPNGKAWDYGSAKAVRDPFKSRAAHESR